MQEGDHLAFLFGYLHSEEVRDMCLSTVYKNEVNDANMLAKNVADIRVENGQIIFTDLMGIRTVFDGSLEKIDLMDNYVIVRG